MQILKSRVAAAGLAVAVAIAGGSAFMRPSTSTAAEPAAAQASGETEALVQEWAAALETGHVERMKPLLADDYLYVNPRGQAIDGGTLLRQLKDRTLKFKITPEGRTLRLHKGALIVSGTCDVAGTVDGQKIDGEFRYLDVFERQGERWVAIASTLTRVEKEKAEAK